MSDTALIPAPARRALRGFGMNQRLGPALRWFARRYVDDIPYPEDVAERVRALSEQGTVVYVHRSRNLAEYLCRRHSSSADSTSAWSSRGGAFRGPGRAAARRRASPPTSGG